MKKTLLVLCITLSVVIGYGQQVEWASKVIGFSSQLTEIQYSAEQALGKPNVMPAGGMNPNAWEPDDTKRTEFIKLGFTTPMQIQQIAVAESYNPGAIFKVYTYDEAGREYLVHTFAPQVIPVKGRMLNVFIEKTPYKVAAVKLEFDGKAVPDYFGLDAVAITDSSYPIIADISMPELLSKGLVVEQLDKNVNSDYSELNPLLSPDGKTLYFSRSNHPGNVGGVNDKEDIWFSELGADGKWTLAKNMGPQFNNKYPNFVNSIATATPDGKSVVLVLGNQYSDKPNGKMLAGVSISNNTGSGWSKPKALKIKDDYNYDPKADYFLSNTRKALLISEQRADCRGGRDLYVSFPEKDDSTWTAPLNLGIDINTAGDETAPFLASDDKTLYFSSNGFSGFGGMDIYMTKRLDDTWTKWSPVENLGPDINSKLDDTFFNIPATSDYAYYSRGVTVGNDDIFRVKLPILMDHMPDPIVIVRGKLIDSQTGKPIGAKIVYEDLATGKEVGIAQSDSTTGKYEIQLPGGKLYGFHADASGHISESKNLDLRNFKKDGVLNSQDIALAPKGKDTNTTPTVDLNPINVVPIAADSKIPLNNIFFDFEKAVLKPESFPELDRIVTLMTQNATMTVEVAGHTDSVGPDDYNLGLSQRRAQSVANYLKGKGIKGERIGVKYFGETKPVESNDTKEGRSKNRRVEFKIVKM
jgi:OmpA-OmpF porin, OOP family